MLMRKKIYKLIFLTIMIFSLVGCKENKEASTGNKDQIKTDVKSKEYSKEDLEGNLVLASDENIRPIEEIKIIDSQNGQYMDIPDDYIIDQDEFDGLSVEEIIKETVQAADMEGDYFVQYTGEISNDNGFHNYIESYHAQDKEGRYHTSYIELNGEDYRPELYSAMVFNGSTYELIPSQPIFNEVSDDDYLDDIPGGLSGSEVFEIIKDHHAKNTNKNVDSYASFMTMEVDNLEEVQEDSSINVRPPVLKEITNILAMYDSEKSGLMLRLKDGYKDEVFPLNNEGNGLDNGEVYHIVLTNNDSQDILYNFGDYHFFIDKKTNLITAMIGYDDYGKTSYQLNSFMRDNDFEFNDLDIDSFTEIFQGEE